VIDREGKIRYWKCEYDAPAMIATIEALLAGEIGVPDAVVVPDADRLRLSAAPNPFHPFTRLTYALDARAPARLSVHDAQGRVVRVLAYGVEGPGTHRLLWDGRDAAGLPVASGVYYARLRVPGAEVSQKLTLVR
jgi:hypothetical protein